METGFSVDFVLENHVALCRHLKIYSSKNSILSYLLNGQIKSHNVFIAVETYLELGGALGDILPVLNFIDNFNEQSYLFLILKLKSSYPDIVRHKLLECLNAVNVSISRKIDYAYILIEIGEKEGLKFLVSQLEFNKNKEFGNERNLLLDKIESSFALEQLSRIINTALNKNRPTTSQDPLKTITANIIFSLALKSEYDLILVNNYLKGLQEMLDPAISDASLIVWYRERILENFRDSDKIHKSLEETTRIISQL